MQTDEHVDPIHAHQFTLQQRPQPNSHALLQLFAGKNQKAGETIHEGHRSYELMLDLQLGIRWSVGKITPVVPPRQLTPDLFAVKSKIVFPRQGSRETPPHPTEDFKWKDYCPMVFRKLRDLFVVDAGEYMISLCGEQVRIRPGIDSPVLG